MGGILKIYPGFCHAFCRKKMQTRPLKNIVSLSEKNYIGTGEFFPKPADMTTKEKLNYDITTASKLWDESMRLAKMK